MADFIRPASSASWFEQDNDLEWGVISDDDPASEARWGLGDEPVSEAPDPGPFFACAPDPSPPGPELPSEDPNPWAVTSPLTYLADYEEWLKS